MRFTHTIPFFIIPTPTTELTETTIICTTITDITEITTKSIIYNALADKEFTTIQATAAQADMVLITEETQQIRAILKVRPILETKEMLLKDNRLNTIISTKTKQDTDEVLLLTEQEQKVRLTTIIQDAEAVRRINLHHLHRRTAVSELQGLGLATPAAVVIPDRQGHQVQA